MVIHKVSKIIFNSLGYNMSEIIPAITSTCIFIKCIFSLTLFMKLWYASYAMHYQVNYMWRASSIYHLLVVYTTVMLIMISKVESNVTNSRHLVLDHILNNP